MLSPEASQKGADALATVMIRNNANYHDDYDLALATLAELRIGVSDSDGF